MFKCSDGNNFFYSSNGKYIICGSEDHFVYIWRTQHMSSTARKDRNDFWEGIRGSLVFSDYYLK